MRLPPRRVIIAIVVVLVAIGGCLAYDRWVRQEPLPEGLIQANGRIEGEHVIVASKRPGKVQKLLAREGDEVKTGHVLVMLDDAQVKAELAQAKQAVATLEAQVHAAQTALAVLKKEVPLAIESAEAGVVYAGPLALCPAGTPLG